MSTQSNAIQIKDKLCYSIAETADLLGISYNNVRILIQKNIIPSIMLGEKRVLIPAAGLRELIEKKLKEAKDNGNKET